MVVSFLFYFIFMTNLHKQNDQLADWADALASMGQAIMLFDEHQNMAMATPRAREYLSPFWTIDQWAKLRLPDIMSLCYENAAEDAGPSGMMENILNTFGDAESGFSEVISCSNGDHLLIQIVGFQKTGTIILIKDISIYTDWYRKTLISDQQRDMLLTAIETTTTAIALFDPNTLDGQILFSNQAFCSIVETPRTEILGQSWKKLLPDCHDDDIESIFERSTMGYRKTYRAQLSIIENLGILFISDITETKEKEEQIRHMQRLESIGQLAGGVAHDFNNILGIIKGYTHLLITQFKDQPSTMDALERMMNACNRGASLAEQLLAISRKQKPVTNQFCAAPKALDTIEKLLAPLLPHEVILKINEVPKNLQLKLPEDQFNQIMMNLIINARDAMMPGGGTVSITVTPPSENNPTHATFQISDTGVGIPSDIIDRIFEPFFTTKELGKGTGLGLAVIYGIIQQYSGTILIDSTIGVGTTFTLTLPAEISEEPAEFCAPSSVINIDLSGLTIMIVEDETDLRRPLAMFLTQQNAVVIEAEDGNAALSVQDDMGDQPIHLLLSDIRMPGGLYGDDLARLWREIRPESKIILMSGYAEGRDVGDGCTDLFLAKPLKFEDLLRSIHDVVQRNGAAP